MPWVGPFAAACCRCAPPASAPMDDLARIIRRVEEAQDARGKVQSFMERFSAWYTPGIIVLALVSGLATGDVVLALTLLVVGCPGALVISIPVAIVAGIGRGAKDGILIKGGEYLETSARISAVALDKDRHAHRGDAAPHSGRGAGSFLSAGPTYWAAGAGPRSAWSIPGPADRRGRRGGGRRFGRSPRLH